MLTEPEGTAVPRRERSFVNLEIGGSFFSISVMRRDGPKTPVLFLHGFGSTKEDFADAELQECLDGHAIVAYDAPGFGQTGCNNPNAIDIPLLARIADGLVAHLGFLKYHLVGHSMGGLTGLLLAQANQNSVLSFMNIEGNLAPEDCFLSRQVHEYPESDSTEFFDRFVDRIWHSSGFASALYAERVKKNVVPEITRPIFESMIKLSDSGELLKTFIGLPCPKLFMYGRANQSLSYLGALRSHEVCLSEIPTSGHFPMYSNPPAMWRSIGDLIATTEGALNG